MGLTDLLGHDGKVRSDKKGIIISHWSFKSVNKDYWSQFLATFETTVKFPIVFVRLILGKLRVKRFTSPWRNTYGIWIWFQGNFKGFIVQIETIAVIFDWFFKQQLNLSLFLSSWSCRKLGLTDIPSHYGKVMSDKKNDLLQSLFRDFWNSK